MSRLKFNYSKLLGKIVEKYGTQAKFAVAMNLSERTLSLKLNSERYFKQSEIEKAAELLDIGCEEYAVYFFTKDVQSAWITAFC